MFFPVTMTDGDTEFHGKCLDISGGGMFVETRGAFAVGSLIALSFSLPKPIRMQVACEAEVAWVNCKPTPRKPQYPLGIGLRFVTLPINAHQAIMQLSESRSKG